MDPNEVLEKIRMCVLSYREHGDEFNRRWDHSETLVDSIETLDEWLSKGGFLPKAWYGGGRLVTQYSGEMVIQEDEFMASYEDGERWTVWTEGRCED